MKKISRLICLMSALLLGCSLNEDCPEGINHLPMYGRVKKCSAQIESDSTFLKQCDHDFNNRKEAAKYFTNRGWDYYYKNIADTAMMRFNQAWLLDSLNANIYWGFANLVGRQGKFKESLPLFRRSIELDSTNAKIWESASNSYGQLFFKTKDKTYLNTTIKYLKTAIKLDANNPRTYASLTAAYTFFIQKDSARKYLKITDGLDRNAVNPQVRKFINGQ
ncbi:tetratricopeptide repeat protein [Mucilaginibacter lappiensis]|uniref:tetratricopeptide repeat protein n=1 Tax=Mucilaginibacter lappiensis TaxID=354630 RepID=UPI003D239ECC